MVVESYVLRPTADVKVLRSSFPEQRRYTTGELTRPNMTISSVTNCCAGSTALPSSTQSLSNVQAEVEKLQRQYDSWANCPSSKTSQGKAKIDQISVKLDAAKQELKKVEESKSVEKTSSVPLNGSVGQKPSLRLDGLGTYVDEMA